MGVWASKARGLPIRLAMLLLTGRTSRTSCLTLVAASVSGFLACTGRSETRPPIERPRPTPPTAANSTSGIAKVETESPDLSVETWALDTLSTLTVDQKIGQLIYPRIGGSFANMEEDAFVARIRAAERGRIGGVVVFAGEPLETAAILNRLQEASKLPLLVASDYEWGPAMRVRGASRFPIAMALGAGATTDDLEFQAAVTAREARALGVHLVLAPVLDLNTNPENTVINGRSFGESPERVAALAEAYVERLQRGGVVATAKHFPGHGATVVDSHVGLPIVSLSRERLDKVELVPFRRVIEQGIGAVMAGHLSVPALDPEAPAGQPATFSRTILTDFLRGELGFTGLVVSDALDMAAARGGPWDGRAAVEAVKAGVDMLLVPPDPAVTFSALQWAVRRGEVTEARLDDAVARILKAKQGLSLHRRRTVDLKDVSRRVGSPVVTERIEHLTERTLTLVRDRKEVIPVTVSRGRHKNSFALIEYVPPRDRSLRPASLRTSLEVRAPLTTHVRFPRERDGLSAEERDGLQEADIVLAVSYSRARSIVGRQRLPRGMTHLLHELSEKGKTVAFASLGDPYVLNEVDADVLMTTYDGPPAAQRALVRALYGEIGIQGRLPVALSPEYPVGHGLMRRPKRMQLDTVRRPEDVGMSSTKLTEAFRLVERAVKEGAAPGAVALVARRGKIVLHRATGNMTYAPEAPSIERDTIFDLASLTKVIATTTLVMRLFEQGRLDLDEPVHAYLPEFRGSDKDLVTVRDLLTHSGGLLWWTDLYKQHEGKSPDDAKAGYLEHIFEIPLDYPPRSKMIYTDLGLLLLGEILERVSGRSLETLTREDVVEPLGMAETQYRPDKSLLNRIAPTEQDPWRNRVVHGEVHDENAYGLGGVAPHAGLFATAGDLARFCQMMLNQGAFDGVRLLKPETIALFTKRAGVVSGSSRALGWDTPSEPSSSGKYFSASSFGHTGFTGTSIWVDPERELFAILLTNRVHLTRENRKIYETRPAFHDAVMLSITDEEIRPREAN